MKTSVKTGLLVLSALSLALFSGRLSAQTGSIGSEEGDKTSLEKNVFGLGINVSLMSGSGISYKEHFARSPGRTSFRDMSLKIITALHIITERNFNMTSI